MRCPYCKKYVLFTLSRKSYECNLERFSHHFYCGRDGFYLSANGFMVGKASNDKYYFHMYDGMNYKSIMELEPFKASESFEIMKKITSLLAFI